jgi:hypothetical protein
MIREVIMQDCDWCKKNIKNHFHFKPYSGQCEHRFSALGTGYGFRRSWGCEGIGGYAECEMCGACSYFLDYESCDQSEIEWFEKSQWVNGQWLKKIKAP